MYPDDLPKGKRLPILSEQQGHRCCYCGRPFGELPRNVRGMLYLDPRPSIEHVIRLADGGRRVWANEVAACRGCNAARGAMDPNAFFELVQSGHDAMRRTLRTRGTVRRGIARPQGWRARALVTLGEVVMTAQRKEYFALVYGPWPKIARPGASIQRKRKGGPREPRQRDFVGHEVQPGTFAMAKSKS